MQDKKEKKKAPGASGYPWEDRALKAAAQFMGRELLPLLGVKHAIKRVAPTEQVYLKTEDFSEDFNYELEGGGLLHLEFESDSITKEDLRRFRLYESLLSYQYKTEVTTCVLCSAKTGNPQSELQEGINLYRVQLIHMKSWNADELIHTLEEKQKYCPLTREELLRLILTPLMGGATSQPERIQRGVHLLRSIRNQQAEPDLFQMQAVLYAFAEKFLTADELRRVKEEIHMTRLGQMIFEDGMQKGLEQGLEKGLEQGLEQGLERGLERGLEQGEARVNQLIQKLLESNRMADIQKAVKDREYQKKLFAEFDLLQPKN